MQIKTTTRYHFTCIPVDIIYKKGTYHVLARIWKNQKPYTRLVGMENGAATTENSTENTAESHSSKKLSIELSHDLGILLLGVDPKEVKAGTQTDISSQQHYPQEPKEEVTQMSGDERKDLKDVVPTQHNIL